MDCATITCRSIGKVIVGEPQSCKGISKNWTYQCIKIWKSLYNGCPCLEGLQRLESFLAVGTSEHWNRNSMEGGRIVILGFG
jgi:hypothetical protein